MLNDYPMGQAPVIKDLINLGDKSAEVVYWNRKEKQMICFSTQLSCPVGCVFCASPSKNKTVNLSTQDMIDQITHAMRNYDPTKPILFSIMGEGEPLLNYKNVIGTIEYLENELFPKLVEPKISLSTSGCSPDKIKELAHHPFIYPFKLQVSVHSVLNREQLVPHSKPIEDIKKAIDYYREWNPTRSIELNFVDLKGINDTPEHAKAIHDMFGEYHVKISGINPVNNFAYGSNLNLMLMLQEYGMSVEYQITDGANVGAACGQTRGMSLK